MEGDDPHGCCRDGADRHLRLAARRAPSPTKPATQDSRGVWEEKQLGTLPVPLDLKSLTWSPDGRTWACRVPRGEKWAINVGGKFGPDFTAVGAPAFSPDG
jgi:hypothetical protein